MAFCPWTSIIHWVLPKAKIRTKASVSASPNLEQTTLAVCGSLQIQKRMNYQCFGFATETGANTLDTETESTHCKQTLNAKQQFYYNTQEFFLLLRPLPARHINTWGVGGRRGARAGTGWHQKITMKCAAWGVWRKKNGDLLGAHLESGGLNACPEFTCLQPF